MSIPKGLQYGQVLLRQHLLSLVSGVVVRDRLRHGAQLAGIEHLAPILRRLHELYDVLEVTQDASRLQDWLPILERSSESYVHLIYMDVVWLEHAHAELELLQLIDEVVGHFGRLERALLKVLTRPPYVRLYGYQQQQKIASGTVSLQRSIVRWF